MYRIQKIARRVDQPPGQMAATPPASGTPLTADASGRTAPRAARQHYCAPAKRAQFVAQMWDSRGGESEGAADGGAGEGDSDQ